MFLSLMSLVTFYHFQIIIIDNFSKFNIGMDDLYSELTHFKVNYEKSFRRQRFSWNAYWLKVNSLICKHFGRIWKYDWNCLISSICSRHVSIYWNSFLSNEFKVVVGKKKSNFIMISVIIVVRQMVFKKGCKLMNCVRTY